MTLVTLWVQLVNDNSTETWKWYATGANALIRYRRLKWYGTDLEQALSTPQIGPIKLVFKPNSLRFTLIYKAL